MQAWPLVGVQCVCISLVSAVVELGMLEDTFQLVSFSICFDLLSVNTFKSFF